MDTKIVTTKEFREWVMSKPADAVYDMAENYGDQLCGCLMVQYAKDNITIPEDAGRWGCGYTAWQTKTPCDIFAEFENNEFGNSYGVHEALYDLPIDCYETFGELQEAIKLSSYMNYQDKLIEMAVSSV